MGRARMSGGIHPHTPWPDKKELLENPGSYTELHPQVVVLPMLQGAGKPAEPVVQEGEWVKIGQPVGRGADGISANVHASVSGKVQHVGEAPLINGPGLAVTIENDRLDEPFELLRCPGTLDELTPEQLVEIVREAGIIGMGGAGFPTHIKLKPKEPVEVLLVNGCECEPMLAADDVLMRHQPGMILDGALAAAKAAGASRIIIGVEDNKPEAIGALRVETRKRRGFEVMALDTQYPQGGEKQLIQAVLGREVPAGALPSAVGVIVLNVATCAAIAEAMQTGMSSVRRICTVTGDVLRPQNIRFPIGTPAQDLLDACGGFVGKPSKIIAGGPMMGPAIDNPAVPLTKGTNGLLVIGEANDMLPADFACIRCNRCVEACPMRLMPQFLDRAWRKRDLKRCEYLRADGCINCGCCSYICPAQRNLAQNIVEAKGELARMAKEAKA